MELENQIHEVNTSKYMNKAHTLYVAINDNIDNIINDNIDNNSLVIYNKYSPNNILNWVGRHIFGLFLMILPSIIFY